MRSGWGTFNTQKIDFIVISFLVSHTDKKDIDKLGKSIQSTSRHQGGGSDIAASKQIVINDRSLSSPINLCKI